MKHRASWAWFLFVPLLAGCDSFEASTHVGEFKAANQPSAHKVVVKRNADGSTCTDEGCRGPGCGTPPTR